MSALRTRLTGPDASPWRPDLVRVAVALLTAGLAALAPARPVPLAAVALVAAAYLLLVTAGALGRLEDGLAVPPGLLLAVDALHLLWGAHLTAGLGPVPGVLGTTAACLLLRLVLLPPLGSAAAAPPASRPPVASPSAAAPACPGGRAVERRGDGPQRQGLQVALAEA